MTCYSISLSVVPIPGNHSATILKYSWESRCLPCPPPSRSPARPRALCIIPSILPVSAISEHSLVISSNSLWIPWTSAFERRGKAYSNPVRVYPIWRMESGKGAYIERDAGKGRGWSQGDRVHAYTHDDEHGIEITARMAEEHPNTDLITLTR